MRRAETISRSTNSLITRRRRLSSEGRSVIGATRPVWQTRPSRSSVATLVYRGTRGLIPITAHSPAATTRTQATARRLWHVPPTTTNSGMPPERWHRETAGMLEDTVWFLAQIRLTGRRDFETVGFAADRSAAARLARDGYQMAARQKAEPVERALLEVTTCASHALRSPRAAVDHYPHDAGHEARRRFLWVGAHQSWLLIQVVQVRVGGLRGRGRRRRC